MKCLIRGFSLFKFQKYRILANISQNKYQYSSINCNVYECKIKPRSLLTFVKTRHFKVDSIAASLIDLATFETVCSDTLEALCDYFEETIEQSDHLKSADVTFGVGSFVLQF